MPFLPSDLAGLAAWYKAGVGVSTTGTDVDSWSDQSGNSRHLSPGNPTFKATYNATGLNSLPVIESGSIVILQTGSSFPTVGEVTIYIVGKQEAGEDDLAEFFRTGDYVQIGRNQFLNGGTPIIGGQVETGGVMDYAFRPATDDTWYTIRLRATTTDYYLSLNNGTEHQVTRSVGGATTGVLALFYSTGGSAKSIAEVIVYDDNYTGNDSALVEYYLQQKYNHYTWTGDIPTEGEEEENNSNSNTMSDNVLQGTNVKFWVREAGTSDTWLEMVCSIDDQMQTTNETNVKKTKCGKKVGVALPDVTLSGNSTNNVVPTSSECSFEQVHEWQLDNTLVEFKYVNEAVTIDGEDYTEGELFSNYGEGYFTDTTAQAPEGETQDFSWTLTTTSFSKTQES